MKVLASVAVTADGYMDDNTPHRLMISTPEDWQEVHRLRAANDAILVGAETLRRDDPSLMIGDPQLREERRSRGMSSQLIRVTFSRSGVLDPSIRFFAPEGQKIVITEASASNLEQIAEIIQINSPITARAIVTELERRGIERLMVEGGAQTLQLFLDEGMVDTLRVAINPKLWLGEQPGAPHFTLPQICRETSPTSECPGGMEVTTYTLHPDTEVEDRRFLRMAIEVGGRCTPSATSYCVGAVVATVDGCIFTGYTHETSPTHHAEQEAIAKALAAGASLRGAAIYSSMEPCSKRTSEPESCSQLIIRHGFGRAIFALYEPDHFVRCTGALTLRNAGIDVRVYPSLAEEAEATNKHLLA